MRVFTQFSSSLHQLWDNAFQQAEYPWPFYLYSWHEAWQKHFGGDLRLLIYTEEKIPLVIPLAINDMGEAVFTGGMEIADYLDAIGPENAKTDAWTAVLAELKKNKATHLVLRNIPDGSKTLEFFRKLPQAVVIKEDAIPILTLPSSFDIYQESLDRKKRHELRRKMRRFEKEYPDPSLRVHTGPDVSIPRLFDLMKNDPDKQKFLSSAMQSFFLSLPRISGLALVQFCIGKPPNPYANTLAIQHDTSLLLYNSGYDPIINGAGYYLKTRIIAWAIENGYKTFNFLQGNERYKYDLGGSNTFVYRVELPFV